MILGVGMMTHEKHSPSSASLKAAAMGHRLRVEIMDSIFIRSATAAEIAEELGRPAASIRYQLRKLMTAGLVSTVDHRHRRGAIEHVYSSADTVAILDTPEFDNLPARVQAKVNRETLHLAMRDVIEAQRSGTLLNSPSGRALLRFPLEVDARGWEQLAKAHREILALVEQIQAECRQRITDTGEKPIQVVSIVLLFETPRPRGQSGESHPD